MPMHPVLIKAMLFASRHIYTAFKKIMLKT